MHCRSKSMTLQQRKKLFCSKKAISLLKAEYSALQLLFDVVVIMAFMYSQTKLVYNDNPWDPKIVAAVDRWSLFRGQLCFKGVKWDLKMVVVVGRWSIIVGGR